jgi:putative acetyltransferase
MFEIHPIQPEQVAAAKRVIYTVAREIFFDQVPLEEGIAVREARGELADLDDLPGNYFNNGGTFLVLTDAGRVIGTGALRWLAEGVCELKRLWLLPEYHGQGLGYRMVQEIFAAARAQGYRFIRLETDAVRQTQAIAFYKRQGFYEIPRYGNDPDELALERAL